LSTRHTPLLAPWFLGPPDAQTVASLCSSEAWERLDEYYQWGRPFPSWLTPDVAVLVTPDPRLQLLQSSLPSDWPCHVADTAPPLTMRRKHGTILVRAGVHTVLLRVP
jgi:hypothetical protein